MEIFHSRYLQIFFYYEKLKSMSNKTEAKISQDENSQSYKGKRWETVHGLSGPCHQAYSCLLRAHSMVLRQMESRFKDEGIMPPDWYDVLLALEYSPEGRLRVGELACRATLSRSGFTRLVDKLEAEGLVERHLNPTDRRSFEVILTSKGRAERERTWPMYARIIAEVFGAHYTDEEAAQLAQLLERQFVGQQKKSCDAGCNIEK
jgi:DNA-binding MarR family transcriptional regulator